jgi:hypothetical protein
MPAGDPEPAIVQLAQEQRHNLVLVGVASETAAQETPPLDVRYIIRHARCRVCVVTPPPIPQEVDGA